MEEGCRSIKKHFASRTWNNKIRNAKFGVIRIWWGGFDGEYNNKAVMCVVYTGPHGIRYNSIIVLSCYQGMDEYSFVRLWNNVQIKT